MSGSSRGCVIGCDHGGLQLLSTLIEHLQARDIRLVARFGPTQAGDRVDYPDVAGQVCRRLLQPQPEEGPSFGLLVCGTGQGMAMSANRISGIRAGVVSDCFSAQMLVAHNNANVLCLGERVVGPSLAKCLLDAYLGATFEQGRHSQRVTKMMALS